MNIVIEGPDGSGKTTLANFLSQQLRLPVIHSPGPTGSDQELNDRIKEYLEHDGIIFDRHPVISEFIYGPLRGHVRTDPELARAFYRSNPLIIYSQSLNAINQPHVVKEHDTPEHLEMINNRHRDIVRRYERWAQSKAMLFWHGHSRARFLGMVEAALHQRFDPVTDVRLFHTRMGITYYGKPRMLDWETLQFRLKFMREEMNEYEVHCDQALHELSKLDERAFDEVFKAMDEMEGKTVFSFDNANLVYHLDCALDALCDLSYLVHGTAYLHGFPLREAWQRVHSANMRKKRVEAPTAERHKMKVIKPEGWEPPSHKDLVEDHAHATHDNTNGTEDRGVRSVPTGDTDHFDGGGVA